MLRSTMLNRMMGRAAATARAAPAAPALARAVLGHPTGARVFLPATRSGAPGRLLRVVRAYSTGTAFDRKEPRAVLELEDGTRLEGLSFGANTSITGEVVFTTAMVGYPESLTDPSYRGQILVLTSPLIGNYGVPSRTEKDKFGLPKFFESDKIQVSGLIVQDYSHEFSHWNAASSLGEWLKECNVPAIHGVDTRLLTKKIREKGALLGKIVQDGDAAMAKAPFLDPNVRNLVAEVSPREVQVFGAGNPFKVLAVHCGLKNNMIRMLVDRGAEVKVVPWDHDIRKERGWYDGLFISNGPGDPTRCGPLIEQLREVLSVPDSEVKPVFGICLGNQLVGLAAGCEAYKLPFGNRGHNQPVINKLTGEAFITSQNHGFAIDTSRLPADWQELFVNVNDGTNEGVMHKTRPYFTAQFHPEHMGGPVDTEFLFDTFMNAVKERRTTAVSFPVRPKPAKVEVRKVLVLGSGGLSIGQAGEFDYSGSQAIKALKEEGVQTVLMNPNIASVQTNVDRRSNTQADNVYFLPLTTDFIELIIRRERPDGILISMGGQTALNCGVALHDSGILEKYGVRVLGTPVESVRATEDRDIFAEKLKEINEKIAPSIAVNTVAAALEAAESIKYPVMIRSAYALGGLGSGICADVEELREMATRALSLSPQILVEKSLKGWKEIEYEVVRDSHGNCITVCNMENFDPLGVHTGDSIVVAPSQTLSNDEYHMLRRTAINVIRHLGIVGECNIQYALDPHSMDYCIIEVNARLSRSSALASKATGYPLAAVAAKLALGIPLPEVMNAVTRKTTACFEPSLDYIVTKIPRWDLGKFAGVSEEIGSAMKSVGEVMAIGRTFEESFQKALRMVDPSIPGYEPRLDWSDPDKLYREITRPTDKRVAALAHALAHDIYSVEELHQLTKIDRWFLQRLRRMEDARRRIRAWAAGAGGSGLEGVSESEFRLAKKLGFSDKQIAKLMNAGNAAAGGAGGAGGARAEAAVSDMEVRSARKAKGVRPSVKQIDTLAAEFPAQTNYLYTTYHGSEDDVEFTDKGVMVLGSGTYRIGSSVEFDWCSVSAIRTLRRLGHKTVVVNYNPETVSTDYDECDRLYFEELSQERVMDIYELESSRGVIVSVGGQIPNNLALPLHRQGVKILGTSPESIDAAEDRFKFSSLMDRIGVDQPRWKELTTIAAAHAFADEVGYPVLVRPSYVLSGAAMSVASTPEQLERFLGNAAAVSPEHPVVITKFLQGALEIEFDGVARNGTVIAHAVSEHVENAGVHSGDATLVLPPQSLSPYYIQRVRDIAAKVAAGLNISGPFNMQLLAKGADVSVIECNLRASRSFPFVSKTVGADFIEAATRVMLNVETESMNLPHLGTAVRPTNFVGIKAPMFSFTRLRGADPVLGVEMASTGEVACFGADVHEAFLKSLLAANFKLPKQSILVSAQDAFLHELIHPVFKLHALGYKILATPKTHSFLARHGIGSELTPYPDGEDESTVTRSPVIQAIRNKHVDLVVNLSNAQSTMTALNYAIRRTAVDFGTPLLTNANLVTMFADAMEKHSRNPMVGLVPDSLFDYYKKEKASETWTDPHEFH